MEQDTNIGTSRRTVVRTAAWAVPAVSIAAAAPAYAASGLCVLSATLRFRTQQASPQNLAGLAFDTTGSDLPLNIVEVQPYVPALGGDYGAPEPGEPVPANTVGDRLLPQALWLPTVEVGVKVRWTHPITGALTETLVGPKTLEPFGDSGPAVILVEDVPC